MNNRMKLAIGIITFSFLYMFGVTFLPDSWVNDQLSNRITTYMQTILTWVAGYYFGTISQTGGAATPPIVPKEEVADEPK